MAHAAQYRKMGHRSQTNYPTAQEAWEGSGASAPQAGPGAVWVDLRRLQLLTDGFTPTARRQKQAPEGAHARWSPDSGLSLSRQTECDPPHGRENPGGCPAATELRPPGGLKPRACGGPGSRALLLLPRGAPALGLHSAQHCFCEPLLGLRFFICDKGTTVLALLTSQDLSEVGRNSKCKNKPK